MANKKSNANIDRSLMQSIAEGISAFLTYEARCGMYPAYCEQFIYGPIVRIAKHLGWEVSSEYPIGKISGESKNESGDYRRIDFLLPGIPGT